MSSKKRGVHFYLPFGVEWSKKLAKQCWGIDYVVNKSNVHYPDEYSVGIFILSEEVS